MNRGRESCSEVEESQASKDFLQNIAIDIVIDSMHGKDAAGTIKVKRIMN